MIMQKEILQDQRLVNRCLSGAPTGWEELFARYHDRLTTLIRTKPAGNSIGNELVEEIAARVWYSVVDNQFELLRRFDARRGCRLIAYLGGIARYETLNFFRSESRRKNREEIASRNYVNHPLTESELNLEIEEFSRLLTRGEQVYLQYELRPTSEAHENLFSDSNRWQLRSRISKKLHSYQ